MPAVVGLSGHVTPRQEAFAREYVRIGIRQKAALNAGFSKNTANKVSWQMTDPDKYPLVAALIAKLKAEKEAELDGTERRIALELGRIAFVDIEQCYDAEGKPKALADMPEDARRALVAVKTFTRETKDDDGETISETRIIDVIAANKLQALKQLADLKGIGRGTGSTNINVAAAAAQASVDWSSIKEQPVLIDNVMVQVEAAKALAVAKEEGGKYETNGHASNGEA